MRSQWREIEDARDDIQNETLLKLQMYTHTAWKSPIPRQASNDENNTCSAVFFPSILGLFNNDTPKCSFVVVVVINCTLLLIVSLVRLRWLSIYTDKPDGLPVPVFFEIETYTNRKIECEGRK